MTVRAARNKMERQEGEGKGEPAISCCGKGKGRKPSSVKQLQDKMVARKLCRPVASVDRAATGQEILAVPERETRHTTWSGEHVLPDREDLRAIMMVERVGQADVFPSRPSLCEHSVCTTNVTNWQPSPTMHAHMLSQQILLCSQLDLVSLIDL